MLRAKYLQEWPAHKVNRAKIQNHIYHCKAAEKYKSQAQFYKEGHSLVLANLK